jgi:protein ImuB
LRLTAVDAHGWREGLRPGLPLADARAAMPALITAPAEPDADRVALAALTLWAGRYGPARDSEGTDSFWVDTGGVAHLYGGEAAMLADLLARLARAGFTARAGLADTHGAAFALARFATSSRTPACIAAPQDTRAALAPLPVTALRLPSDTVLLLQRLGLGRIGQLYPLPREALAQRFRTARSARAPSARRAREAALLAGIVLARLDQALGAMPEPRRAMAEPPRHLVRRLLAEPLISAAGIASALEDLANELTRLLDTRGQGGTRFTLALYRTDGSVQEVGIGASRPCRDPRHIMVLLGAKLDAIDAGFGIDAMTLAATQTEPLGARQIVLTEDAGARAETGAAALVDRLTNRLGALRVFRLVAADSHIPERAQHRVPALAAGAATAHPPAVAAPVPSRPPFLLATPEPIRVLAEVPEGPPLRFSWRRLTHRIVRAEGPERIEPEWWRAIGRTPARSGTLHERHLGRPRDYYRVEDEQGGRYWVFRAGLYGRDEEEDGQDAETGGEAQSAPPPLVPAWFMHGVLG